MSAVILDFCVLQLKERLAHYGVDNFEDLTLVEDTKNEGMNRGFAFLDFSSRADALEACKRLQKRDVVFGMDRTARVAFADTFIEPDDEIMSHVRAFFFSVFLGSCSLYLFHLLDLIFIYVGSF